MQQAQLALTKSTMLAQRIVVWFLYDNCCSTCYSTSRTSQKCVSLLRLETQTSAEIYSQIMLSTTGLEHGLEYNTAVYCFYITFNHCNGIQ